MTEKRKFYIYESTGEDVEAYYMGLFEADFTPQVGHIYALEVADGDFENYVGVGCSYRAGYTAKFYMVQLRNYDPMQIRRATLD